MKFIETEFPELLIIQPDLFEDNRGYFFESYNKAKLAEYDFHFEFVQDNFSFSKKGTIRGLHFQIEPFAQGKLCLVVIGEVLDVAVDLRINSPTYGRVFKFILSEKSKTQLFIPAGFAHGFSVLSDEAIFHYKCTNFFHKESERIIRYDDPYLNIDWMVENPLVSEKDLKGEYFGQLKKYFYYEK